MKSLKYLLAPVVVLSVAGNAWSQVAEAAAAPAADPTGEFARIMTWVLGAIGALLFIVAMVYVVRVNQFLYKRVITLEAQRNGVNLPDEAAALQPKEDDFWTKMRKKYWENPVPIEREADIDLHHDYDGIRELDNSLPPWWVNMFIVTIIWSAIYMFYYHFGGSGPSSSEEYKMDMERAKKEIAIASAGSANMVDESSVTLLTDAAVVAQGETIYTSNCAACHGQALEGGIGPNLTDQNWIHGGGIKNVFKTIKVGVPDKGMVAWEKTLRASDIQKVASFILSKQGTNPPNAKAPQGDVWKDEAAAPAADTTATKPAATGSESK